MKKISVIAIVIIWANLGFAQRCAYVLNGNAETLSRIDLETGAVINHIATTGPVPNQVVYYDGLLYVVNSGSASLQIINPENNNTIAEIPLPLSCNPMNVAFIGQYAYVTGMTTAGVYKINLESRSVIDTFAVGRSPAGILAASGVLYVANTAFNPVDLTYGQGSVTVLSPVDGQRFADINVGKNPQALALGTDDMINVICTGNYSNIRGKIYFINPANNRAIDSLPTGGDPYWPVLDNNGIGYISAGGWTGNGVVFSYNAVTRTIIRGQGNPIAVANGAMGLAMDSLGMLYCTGQSANAVTRFTGPGQITATYNVGGGPVSITIMDRGTGIASGDSTINPAPINLGVPYPNPFNSTVVIPFSGTVRTGQPVFFEIYDILGQLICRFEPAREGIYQNNIVWDGRDSRGVMASSGIYFIRMAGTWQTAKMVLLR
jgi:YVTN family beta-propeller protein